MAELILPLTRTLFLPIGCPSLGSVERVSGDLRDVRCGSSGGEAYCLGEADILIEYTAPLGPASMAGGTGGRPCFWQAMLSFPFQLSGRGALPRDSACRVELGQLDWTMVASRAIELETEVRVSYDLPREEKAEIKTMQRTKKRESEGGWQMVSLNEEEERPAVEIVDLSGNAEQEKIKQAVAEALAAQEAVAVLETAEAEKVSAKAEDGDREEPKKSPVPLPEPVPAPTLPYQAAAEAVAEAVDVELLEPEVLPPEEALSRPKRRFRGLPGLHVEAYDNDIDVTAFHISIKL